MNISDAFLLRNSVVYHFKVQNRLLTGMKLMEVLAPDVGGSMVEEMPVTSNTTVQKRLFPCSHSSRLPTNVKETTVATQAGKGVYDRRYIERTQKTQTRRKVAVQTHFVPDFLLQASGGSVHINIPFIQERGELTIFRVLEAGLFAKFSSFQGINRVPAAAKNLEPFCSLFGIPKLQSS